MDMTQENKKKNKKKMKKEDSQYGACVFIPEIVWTVDVGV